MHDKCCEASLCHEHLGQRRTPNRGEESPGKYCLEHGCLLLLAADPDCVKDLKTEEAGCSEEMRPGARGLGGMS